MSSNFGVCPFCKMLIDIDACQKVEMLSGSSTVEDASKKRIDELEKSVHDQIIEDAERITKLEAIIKSLKEQTSKITDSDDIDDYTMGSIWDTYETD